jgi:hypothetical protein
MNVPVGIIDPCNSPSSAIHSEMYISLPYGLQADYKDSIITVFLVFIVANKTQISAIAALLP